MYLNEIITAQNRGEARGIPSICSAHPWVLRAVISLARQVLIEATCNQVNQFGGYTGMQPEGFVRYVQQIAKENHFPVERILLGGDHLGPSVWQHEPADAAMQKAEELVRRYVRAGFEKLHLDTSMRLGDDAAGPLPVEVCAARAARLAKVVETARVEGLPAPRYVIGSEVPVPGGARGRNKGLAVTAVESVRETLAQTHKAFRQQGVEPAWERVVAVVVQPGVEFGDDFVSVYQPERARALARWIEAEPGWVYEVHSTDYQPREALRNLVQDHFAILKVGPALTFAFREAVFALAMIEAELFPPERRSNLMDVLDAAMVRHPEHWQQFYHGTEDKQVFARKYSLSDRARYYWGQAEVQQALRGLFGNLRAKPLPRTLLSQFVPEIADRIRFGEVENSPEAIVLEKIGSVVKDYGWATGEQPGLTL